MKKRIVLFIVLFLVAITMFTASLVCIQGECIQQILIAIATGIITSALVAFLLELIYAGERNEDRNVMRKEFLSIVEEIVAHTLVGLTIVNKTSKAQINIYNCINDVKTILSQEKDSENFCNSVKVMLQPFALLDRVRDLDGKLNLYFANKVFTENEYKVLSQITRSYSKFYYHINASNGKWVVHNMFEASRCINQYLEGIEHLSGDVKEFIWLQNVSFDFAAPQKCGNIFAKIAFVKKPKLGIVASSILKI